MKEGLKRGCPAPEEWQISVPLRVRAVPRALANVKNMETK